jgi:hypothetical protein
MDKTNFYKIIDDSTYEILGERFHRYQIPLLDLAQKLHMSITGTGSLYTQESLIAYGYIQARLETWRQEKYRSAMYDSAVFLLLSSVSREYEARYLEHDLNVFFKDVAREE